MENVFELNKIREKLRKFLTTSAGNESLDRLKPGNGDIAEIKEKYNILRHWIEMCKIYPPPFDFPDLTRFKTSIENRGTYGLSFLFTVMRFLQGISSLRQWLKGDEKLSGIYLTETKLISPLFKRLKEVFDESGEVRDNATPRLSVLRSKRRKLLKKILSELGKLAESYYKIGALQDTEIRLREGRCVLLFKSSGQSWKGKGHILGRSRKGESVYIEPGETMSLQNELIELEEEEKEEILRIRRELSAFIQSHEREIKNLYNELGALELLNAKYRFAEEINGEEPTISKEKFYNFHYVHHPLIFMTNRESSKPYNFSLPANKSVFLISGPNGGGKTVFLKTLGLLTQLIQMGIPVPCRPQTHFYIPNRVFGIGFEPEGSIEQGESNFTGFLLRIKQILDQGLKDSLILIDEFMGNTDPDEGTGLGYAILQEISRKEAKTFCVTHLGPLKALIEREKGNGMTNAAFGFDPVRKVPTYELCIDAFEESFAIETAHRVGFPEDIIEKARTFSSQSLSLLKRMKEEMERKRREMDEWIKEKEEEIENLKKEKEKEIIEVLGRTLEETNRYLRTLKQKKSPQKVEKIIKDLKIRKATLEGSKPEKIEIGNFYRLMEMDVEGKLLKVKGKRAMLQVGTFPLWVPVDTLLKPRDKKKRKKRTRASHRVTPPIPFGEISIRGMERDTAMDVLNRYITEAFAGGKEKVRVVHGQGGFVLKKMVWKYLKNKPFVKAFYHPPYNEGGYGVTIVEFKEE